MARSERVPTLTISAGVSDAPGVEEQSQSRATRLAFSLLAIMTAASCTGDQQAPSESKPKVAQIRSLRLVNVEPDKVIFEWSLTTGVADSIEVTRDGIRMELLTGGEVRFVDSDVIPGSRYTYEVTALAGSQRSQPQALPARTPVPPIGEARLDGSFRVVFVVLESTLAGQQGNAPERWEFEPVCPDGPCDTRLRAAEDGFSVRLAYFPARGRYEGLGVEKGGFRCDGVPNDARTHLMFRVLRARVIDGAWTASKLTGRIKQDDFGEVSCLPALWEAALRLNRASAAS